MLPPVLQGIASGVVTGCVYALIALSLVIVYKSSDVINFAGGEMVMVGGQFIMHPNGPVDVNVRITAVPSPRTTHTGIVRSG